MVDARYPVRLQSAFWSTVEAAGLRSRPRVCSGMLLCGLWGREGRFSRPSIPLARKRAIHLWAVVVFGLWVC